MKLPNFRRIMKGDYPEEDQGLIDQLSAVINQGLEQVYFALDNRLTLSENLACTVGEFEIEVNSGGIPKARTVFKVGNNQKIDQVIVGDVESLTASPVYPTSGVTVSWSQVTDGILISHITGLPANVKYRVKVTAYT